MDALILGDSSRFFVASHQLAPFLSGRRYPMGVSLDPTILPPVGIGQLGLASFLDRSLDIGRVRGDPQGGKDAGFDFDAQWPAEEFRG